MAQLYPGRLRTLHLFAGCGGGLLADLLLGHRPVCAVELDPYCQQVLMQRQRDGVLPWFPIWGDVRDFDGRPWLGCVDVVSGGFPCQPWSVAGKRAGAADDRNLWPDTVRVVRDIRPRYVFLENVPGLLTQQYFGTMLGDLAQAGYDARWLCLGADDVGAPHHRKRLWILADAAQQRRAIHRCEAPQSGWGRTPVGNADFQGLEVWKSKRGDDATECSSVERTGGLANAQCKRLEEPRDWGVSGRAPGPDTVTDAGWGLAQPGLGRVADGLAPWLLWAWPDEPGDVPRVARGIPDRVARLRALGNGQVPLCAAVAWRLLTREDTV